MFVTFVYFSLIRIILTFLLCSLNRPIFEYSLQKYVYVAYNINKKSYISGCELRLIILIIIFTFGIFSVRHNIHMMVVNMQYIIWVSWLKWKLWNCHDQIWWLNLYLVLSWMSAKISQTWNTLRSKCVWLRMLIIIIGWKIIFNRQTI